MPFVEILNFHSHTNRSVNIYLKEGTIHYMTLAKYYIVNMTLVNIESYTDGVKTPSQATIFGVDYNITIFSPTTVMNILTSDTLRLQQQISRPEVTNYERTLLSGFDSQIYLLRTNLRMNRIDVRRDTEKDKLREGNFIK